MAWVLVIDTCGTVGYVALANTTAVEAAGLRARRLGVRATQEELLPAIQELLSEVNVALHELAAIAVVQGPGSFTGVRIGLATSKGLCEAAGILLVTLSRLAVLAAAARATPVVACLQAGRGDVYAALFAGTAPTEQEEVTENECVCTLEDARRLAGSVAIAVCEEALRGSTPSVVFVDEAAFTHALCTAAMLAVTEQRWGDVALADARYVRVPDAELALRARQG